jgi:hypothetical protein
VRITDALVHAWDLAKATGLATQLLAASRQRMTGSLRGTFFGDPQPLRPRPAASRPTGRFLERQVGKALTPAQPANSVSPGQGWSG